ncbi:hypothetical protein FHS27_004932 [Rhodopirellula rubra]|uniref:Uncharacterized protein n=1 Tax=Aporhodopirellula rubra TaxID=980271 RepID=A0A7W5E2N4_9BACT|nr:hypothetical protein [Aporhodopirellula rubra]MBB3209096.1 hypothetical protein [Aporhodopirellula rubra]
MKAPLNPSQVDLWISGVALFLALALLVASTVVCVHSKSSKARSDQGQFSQQMFQ